AANRVVFSENRQQALTRKWWGGSALPEVIGVAGQFQNRWRQIDRMTRRVPQFSSRRNALRPMQDERSRDTAFVHPCLVAAERRVCHRGPSWAETEKRRARSALRVRIVSVAAHHHF